MKRLGVTGGIGSGKSTFCKFLERNDTRVLYADLLAKDIMQEVPEVKNKIIRAFGSGSYNADGTLNRKYLSTEAFGKGRASELNRIVHPVVQYQTKQIMAQAEKEGCKLFIYEAALLLNYGKPDYLDFVVWIEASEDIRVDRVAVRDNVESSAITERIKHQQTFESVKDYVDFVIYNNGNLSDLREEAERVYLQLVRR